jgi:conjugative relaxase-like TrwC/TraI family protein
MLSMSVINNIDYYCDLASEDYYISNGEPKGKWSGLGAQILGLHNEVETNIYRNILGGFSPDGTALCERQNNKHRSGWDLTFSAPKTVSILWARSDINMRAQIQAAQHSAVEQALFFLENHAAVTRRGHGGSIEEPVVGLVAALFEHSTSRAQDPQLHTHCLVANIAPRVDGSWGTLESKRLFQWQKAAGSIYRSTLANHLREIGFSIEQLEGQSHFEIQGIPKNICAHFSKRTKDIEAALKAMNVRTSASPIGSLIKLITRDKKQLVDRSALFLQWHKELDELGLSAERVKALVKSNTVIEQRPLPLTSIMAEMIEKYSVFRLQELYAAVAVEAQWQHANLQAIEGAVQHLIEQKEVIALGLDYANNQIFSTPTMIAKEQQIVRIADHLQQRSDYQLSEHSIQIAIQKQNQLQDFALSDEQTEAVFRVCQSGLDILEGIAGTGKSASMKAVKYAYESSGFKIIGATLARQAANQLETETGIDSYTLAKLLDELANDRMRLDHTIVLIDEAGQISSPDLLRLFEAVQRANGKVILVGEQQQMDAISHGGSLRFLSQRYGCAHIETIRRQREQWAREAVKQFRVGDATSALRAYQQHGLLHFADTSTDVRDQLVNQWKQFQQKHPHKQSMILAQSWQDVQLLNLSVRSYYQEKGLVGNENIETECFVSNRVMRFQFSKGERIRFARNDYRRGFTNGELGTIQQIEKRDSEVHFTIQCDNGRIVSLKQSDYCNEKGCLYLSQAYANTVYASQGSTINGDVFVYYTSGMDRSATYVAGSRHKNNCHWFINREEMDALMTPQDGSIEITDQLRILTLADRMSTNRRNFLAIEYLQVNTPQLETQHSNKSSLSRVISMELEAV